MKQRTTLFVSAGLTAFVLVVAGAVAGLAAQNPVNEEPTPVATIDAAVQELLDARESEYRVALEEANAKLEEAYDRLAEIQTAIPPTETPEERVFPVSAELAVGLALNLAPSAELERWPELVDFRGIIAYEVLLDRGPVYISATDAMLLYDGTVEVSVAAEAGGEGYYDDDDDEHEEHEEDEKDEEDEPDEPDEPDD